MKKSANDPPHLSGLILSGGAGRRMGGADKGLVAVDGRPLISSVLDRFVPQVAEVMISANRNLDRYRAFGYPVVSDVFTDPAEPYPGPLAGIHAGLTHAQSDWLLCVPCDAPLLPNDLGQRLAAAVRDGQDTLLAVACCTDRLQPTFCLLHRTLLPALAQALRAGVRKVATWQQAQGATVVDFKDVGAFANLNVAPAGHRTEPDHAPC